jgi:hypothetical protein
MKSSKTPLEAIQSVTYPGQSPERRKYHAGYENFMDQMPDFQKNDLFIQDKVLHARSVMQLLASKLVPADWPKENPLSDNQFDRIILAIENPITVDAEFPGTQVVNEGSEIVMARWGNGFTSPVHGHAAGYMHEEILFGKWHDLWNFEKTRDDLVKHFGISDIELERRILTDPDVNFLYRGMIRFMGEEVAMKSFPSGNQLQKFAKKLAREMMFRNEAYSELVKREFSNSIRLSMHPSVNNGAKYSFQLIKGKDTRYSAWHCAIAVDQQGQIITIHRKDAEAAGYELIYENNQPFYYASR